MTLLTGIVYYWTGFVMEEKMEDMEDMEEMEKKWKITCELN